MVNSLWIRSHRCCHVHLSKPGERVGECGGAGNITSDLEAAKTSLSFPLNYKAFSPIYQSSTMGKRKIFQQNTYPLIRARVPAKNTCGKDFLDSHKFMCYYPRWILHSCLHFSFPASCKSTFFCYTVPRSLPVLSLSDVKSAMVCTLITRFSRC